jgi:hypothetical protein
MSVSRTVPSKSDATGTRMQSSAWLRAVRVPLWTDVRVGHRRCRVCAQNLHIHSSSTEAGLQKTDPHSQLILYSVLLFHGRRQSNFIRSHKHWQPLIPLLMDHVLVEINPDTEDIYLGAPSISSGSGSRSSMVVGHIPIEAKLRSLGVRLLYEVCRVQKLSLHDLSTWSCYFYDDLLFFTDFLHRCFQRSISRQFVRACRADSIYARWNSELLRY